ncbi:MAG: alpha-ketoglutarate-dependent dioxygenase AlkB [Neisseria sp.]|uniref:alpha-ketoglutarate-dependent dioxygenase AlkB family protein n=1 Tax=Neisseria sp. TaxID=192066 RepID=UPI0026DD4BFF|nr:alpha-ketoglutarate-dependent dioxygenase AlkB [Neisseria sp.]MDO4640267.1 alpha-ketoglutarate-dependent dioxygenase AlkB [Neisseria sp.]
MNNDDLFETPNQPTANLLPYDGEVNDYGVIFDCKKSDAYYLQLLQQIAWQHDTAVIYGKRITTARQVAWYGEKNFNYHYSGATRTALPWTDSLLELKQIVEQHLATISPTLFNSCLLNLYTDGNQGMAWHSDDEKCLIKNGVIASLSFGATRKFAFRHKKDKQKIDLWLKHGQLIVMKGTTQTYWQHAVMKSTRINQPRINLTFRTMVG